AVIDRAYSTQPDPVTMEAKEFEHGRRSKRTGKQVHRSNMGLAKYGDRQVPWPFPATDGRASGQRAEGRSSRSALTAGSRNRCLRWRSEASPGQTCPAVITTR